MSDHAQDKADLIRSYARAGIHVNPVYVSRKSDGKKDVRPVGRWRNTSSASLADVEAWYGEMGEHKDASVLIDCGKSKIVVIDLDGPEAIELWHSMEPPLTPAIVSTPGNGEHWYYRAHPDHPIGNDQDGTIGQNIDVRGLGGFVIAPPSTDWRGAYYWEGPGMVPPAPDLTNLPYVPQLVIDKIKAKRSTPPAPAVTAATNTTAPDYFDPAGSEPRYFTEHEAHEFVKKAYTKLAGTDRGFNGAINDFAMACAHFPQWFDRERCARLVIKALGEKTGWTEPDYEDRNTINSAFTATEAGRSWTATERVPDPAQVVDKPVNVLPAPSQPFEVARELVERMDATDGHRHRSWWRGDFYIWTGTRWIPQKLEEIEHWLYAQTGDAVYYVPADDEDEDPETKPWAPNRKKIGDLTHALGVGKLQHFGEDEKCMALANGVLDIEARELQDHTPARFNLSSLPFPYEPGATAPSWGRFLDSVLPGDMQAQDFLAEWFGYVLSGRTDMQKMASLVGAPRGGKGTIARILTAMVGREGVTGTDLGSLGDHFGRADLIGKSLATMGDVRWNARNAGEAVPFLLGIIGEDVQTVARKHRDDWTGRMGVRFMMMGNDTPRFSDRSGALAERMIHVKFAVSFAGRENLDLERQLLQELPGILNWSLAGLDRVNAQKRFTVPDSSKELARDVRTSSNPIGEFLDDCCDFGEDQSILLDHLLTKYKNWCEVTGRTRDHTTSAILSREVQGRDGVSTERPRQNGRRVTELKGVGSSWL